MMSPKLPPHPLPAATMAESPRPAIHTSAFLPFHHLPPPIFGAAAPTTPRILGPPGPVLAPLAIPNAGLPLSRPPSISQPPRPHGGVRHAPQDQHDAARFDHHLLVAQSAYNSPPVSAFPSPSFSNFDRGFGRPVSTETDHVPRTRNSSTSTVVPSPSFSSRRPSGDDYRDDMRHSTYSQFTPVSVDAMEENRCSRSEAASKRSPCPYEIRVRQQPVAARACGFGERDRRVIDPPPIVELIVSDPATGHSDTNEIRYPFNVVHCTLFSVDGNSDETALIGSDKRLTRRLMGTLVSSPFVGMDETGKEGCFFCFPDLSCRTHGKYRLRFVLMRLEPSDLQPDGYTPIITTTLSDVFTVYTAKEFPGMRASTDLTKALKRQGCAISVKKGNEKATGQAGGSSKDEESGDEDTPSNSSKTKRRRKGP